MILEVE